MLLEAIPILIPIAINLICYLQKNLSNGDLEDIDAIVKSAFPQQSPVCITTYLLDMQSHLHK